MATLEYRQRIRRDTAANFTLYNPTLLLGEMALETDTKKVKIGDGVTNWANLEYDFVTRADVGVAGGVAPLNELGKIPVDNISLTTTASSTGFTPAGNLSSTNVQAALQELDNEKARIQSIRSAGVVIQPTYTDNGDGTVTLGSGTYMLYDNANYSGEPREYVIAGTTLTLTDNSANYIMADYNGGAPTINVITSVPNPATTDSYRIPIFSAYRSGTDIHYFAWDHLSLGLAEKINQRLRRTDRFHIDNGLALSESPTRIINIASGAVWAGAALIDLNAINSTSPEIHFYYHSAGSWVRGTVGQYDNSQYDNGTNLVTLTNNKYAVNWIYRSVQPTGSIYVLLGNGDYSLIEAQASKEPAKPTEISTQAVLVGRIIVLKGATTATQIDKVVDVTFGASAVLAHNDLTGLQGGLTNEYYHLSSSEYTGTGSGVFVRQSGADLRLSTTTQSGNYTATLTDYTIRASGTTSQTITLPDASTCSGKVYNIKKVGITTSSVTVDAFSTQTIDGSLTVSINTPFLNLTLQSNGTGWDII